MTTCPSCGHTSEGRFCAQCGTRLGAAAACAACDAELQPGDRFCTQCGQNAGTATARASAGDAQAAAGGGSNLPWYLLGAAIAAIALLLVMPTLRENTRPDAPPTAPFAGGSGAPAGMGTPPPLTGTPRENADALFNRIMSTRESGDSAGAAFFTPMAIEAYDMARPLDDDGRYHLALVHIVARNYEEAVAVAEEILAGSPNHLLGLAAAAEASAVGGDLEAARAYARRFVDAYPTEKDRQVPEYLDHNTILPDYEREARALVGG